MSDAPLSPAPLKGNSRTYRPVARWKRQGAADDTSLPVRLQASVPAFLQILEVTDCRDRLLMLMQPEPALRQNLYRRIVCVALYGKKGILHLHKRTEPMLDFHGHWDLCSGAVLVGEAREDAATRLISACTDLADLSATEIARRPADRDMPSHLTFFSARLPWGITPTQQESMAVDIDELEGLVTHTPELLTPALLWAWETGRLFN